MGLGRQLVHFCLRGLSAEHRVETVVNDFALLEGSHFDSDLVDLAADGGSAALLLARTEGSKPAEHADAAVDRSSWLHSTL
jgi:hypothetical protein